MTSRIAICNFAFDEPIGTANTTSTAFADLGRVTSVANPLATGTGLFQYTYVPDTARVGAINYPNGQQTNFSYYGNTGDDRLQEISNLGPSSTVLSQFNYGYDAEGEITSWQQSSPALSGTQSFALAYDLAGAALTSGTSVTSNIFGYDNAGNRTQEQVNTATTTFTYNNLNQLTGQSAGGLTQFRGTLSKWATVTVGGNAAAVTGTSAPYQFSGAVNLTTGTNTVRIVATGTSGVSGTNNYQVVVASGSGTSLSYDADGEMTGNGAGQNYQWDAANRLVKIWYGALGSSANTTFTYNGSGQRVGIVETDGSGNVTCTKQFVWCPGDAQPSEERDASDNVTKRFYGEGEQISGSNYYYTRDHLGSIRELTGASGAVVARYTYDLWGNQTTVSGTLNADFGYAGYYQHFPSGLDLTLFRAYNPLFGRWISRDPLGEAGGINLYGYVLNDPVIEIDMLGLSFWSSFGTGLLVGLASTAIVLGTAALAVAVIPAAAPVVAGTLLVTGALGIVSAAVSVIRDHSADNVGYNLGAFTGSAVIGASTGTTFSEMLSPAKYAPPDQIPPLVQSTLANAWTDQQGNISPLAFLNDWMFGNPVPGEPNPMETGPDTWAAIGTLTGNGTGAADALNWLFYTPCP